MPKQKEHSVTTVLPGGWVTCTLPQPRTLQDGNPRVQNPADLEPYTCSTLGVMLGLPAAWCIAYALRMSTNSQAGADRLAARAAIAACGGIAEPGRR